MREGGRRDPVLREVDALLAEGEPRVDDGIMPSRAQCATAPERTWTWAAPRAASICSSSTWAITLRAVFA